MLLTKIIFSFIEEITKNKMRLGPEPPDPLDDKYDLVETEPKKVGFLKNTKYMKIDFSEDDYPLANLTDFENEANDPTTDERKTVEEFVRFVVNDKLNFKWSEQEVNGIKEAVNEAIHMLAKMIGEKFQTLEMSHIYAVGSMAEGTRLGNPDEYDFLIVTKPFWSPESFEAKRSYSENECECKSKYDCMSDTIFGVKPNEVETKPHAHIKLTSLDARNLFKTRSKLISDPRMQLKHRNIHIPVVENNMGKLEQKKYSLSRGIESYMMTGPALTFPFKWISNNTTVQPLDVSVDFVFAIEVDGVDTLLGPEDVDISMYKTRLKEYNKYLLLPDLDHTSSGFKYAFTNVEIRLMQELSENHKLVYKFLKFLFESSLPASKSYFVKTCLLRHVAECCDGSDVYGCIKGCLSKVNPSRKPRCFITQHIFFSTSKLKIHIGAFGDPLELKIKMLELVKSAGKLKAEEFESYYEYLKDNFNIDNLVTSDIDIPADSERITVRY